MTSTAPLKSPEVDRPGQAAQRLEQVLQRLRTLLEDDEGEQQETFAYLQRAIEEDRPAVRNRFGTP